MPLSLPQLLLGLLLAVAISAAAYRFRSLNLSGAAAAALLGAVVFGLGGLSWAVLLMAFFVSSSGLSRLAGRRKAVLSEKFSKGHRRDAGQVLANGGVAGLVVLLRLAFPEADWPWAAFAGALAAANADTWATELGVLSRRLPRLITTWRTVERGASGGVTAVGTLAALAGAAWIAVFAAALWPGGGVPWLGLGAVVLAGLAGSLVDSLLGATVQSIYYCPACEKETERHPQHVCGTQTVPLRGWRWLDNDWVNAVCTLTGAVLAAVLVYL